MPYVHLNLSKQLSPEESAALRDRIASLMPLLPGKTRENTMIQIDDTRFMALGDPNEHCLFLDVRLYQPSPFESKRAFVAEISKALEEMTGVKQDHMYMNLIEMNEWGSRGLLNRAEQGG